MKKWTLTFLFIILTAISVLLVLRGQSMKGGEPTSPSKVSVPTDNRSTTAVPRSPSEVIFPKPRMFKSKTYPPQTAEEIAMWDWWRAMRKTDPGFEWKTPIEFYGKVVDQFGEPVAGAKATLMWSAMGGTQGKEELTGNDGKFSLIGAQGKGLSVEILKDGYLRTSQSRGSFEYAGFFEDDFHIPEPTSPVIFRLRKITNGAEPMYKYLPTGKVALGGPPLILNVSSGKIGCGDLAFSINLGKRRSEYGPDYTLTIEGNGGACFAPSNDEFLFSAPESGYQSTLTVKKMASSSQYSRSQKLRFYVKTGDGKYAAVEIEIDLREKTNNAGFFAIIYYNPSGSRNLEFDQSKCINR